MRFSDTASFSALPGVVAVLARTVAQGGAGMTTSQKLWLGFGTLTALFASVCGMTVVRLRSVEGNVAAEANVDQPRSAAAREFDLFTQVDRTLGRAQGGLGIGLALVKSLVELHGGRVEARSTGPGQASEFVVR